MDKPQELTRAWEQVLSGHFRDGLISFSRVAHDFRWRAEARFGMGVAHLSLGEDVQAEVALWESLQQRTGNADALFYLGLVAERRGRRGEAAGRYREALALNGEQPHARARLAALASGASGRPQLVPPPTVPRSEPVSPGRAGVPSSALFIPQQPGREELTSLLDALEISARPRLTAYLGSLDPEVLAPIPVNLATIAVLVVMAVTLFLPEALLPPLRRVLLAVQLAATAGVVLQLLAIALTVVRVSRIRARIRAGRVEIEGDIFQPGGAGIDLARVTSLHLRRTGINWLTGDGTLAFTSPAGTLLVTGIARGERLSRLYHDLLQAQEHLRAAEDAKPSGP
jgi:hypothetical protein